MNLCTSPNQAFRDPLSNRTGIESFRVIFNDRICSPDFNSIGAARAYLELLERGVRKPEYAA